MTQLSHDLAEVFAGKEDIVHELKAKNTHFHKLMEKSHDLYKQIHNIKTDVTPASDETLEDLEKQRLALLDEMAAIVASEVA